MAGVLVDVLLDRLANLALDKVERDLNLVIGIKDEFENLTSNLEAIKAVQEDAEQRRVTEASVRRWLEKLYQVSFEMDDVLDEWITEVDKHDMKKQENQGDQTKHALVATTESKICFPFSSCFGETFGRDEEKSKILCKLLGESSEGGKRVPTIIPVVGMGGMGKTTLAQLVYNDERVKSHFDCPIWVCVSDPFDVIMIAGDIVEGLGGNNSSNVLQTLMQRIYELLKGKKYLLVLDDVWNPKPSQWEELIKPLANGAIGSKLIVTTRKEDVATLMKCEDNIVRLEKLREDYCLALFNYNAGMDEGESSMFQEIGKLIVKKCDGLPLVAKTLGSHMRGKKTIKEWQDVLDSDIWKMEEIKEDVFRPLLLSYHDLPPAVKHCLLYCVVFPKDHRFERDNLIELWSSQDYLNARGNNSTVQQGQQYFNNLVMRSFLQGFDKKGNMYYKIHDIVHDFLQYLTTNECKIIDLELGTVGDKMKELNETVRHLTLIKSFEGIGDSIENFEDLMKSPEREYVVSLLKCKNMRTFVTLGSFKDLKIFELIVQLKCLRTLNLSYSGIRGVPKEISGLIHLRYLDLSDNRDLEELPDTLSSSLYNLQTLRLQRCRSFKKIDLRGMINLRNLHVRGCLDMKLMGIETLTNQQTLDEFYVQSCDGGNKVEDLKDLNQLQGSLKIWYTRDGYSGEKTIMVNKARLQHLFLQFSYVMEKEMNRELLDALQPHPGLEALDIRNYQGTTLTTDWLLSLSNLTRLTIEWCSSYEFLPPLGKLTSLKLLKIHELAKLRKVGVEFLGIDDPSEMQTSTFISFPKLKQLEFKGSSRWRLWQGVEEETTNTTRIMPCLSDLTIRACFSLKQLPDFLWKAPLQTVDFTESWLIQIHYEEKLQEMKMDKEMNSNFNEKFIFHTTTNN